MFDTEVLRVSLQQIAVVISHYLRRCWSICTAVGTAYATLTMPLGQDDW